MRFGWTLLLALTPLAAGAQPGAEPAQVFTLADALRYADDHYPAVRVAVEQVTASSAGIDDARSAALPRLDGVWQVNRATANNIFGLMLPQAAIPPLSGPELAGTTSQSVWGSAIGALLSWEPMDFGARSAAIRVAEAGAARAKADATLTRLDVQGAVGAAFLSVVHAEQALAAALADLERRRVLATAARALVDNALRPGAEASRADAERAAADTRVVLARQDVTLARITLARVLGTTGGVAGVNATALLASLPPTSSATAPSTHPLEESRRASIDIARSREDVLARAFRPRVFLQSSVFARGSGASPDGPFDGGGNGLWFERANWAAGVNVVFPNLFELPSLRARRAAAAAVTRQEQARNDEAKLSLTAQQQAATAMVEAARAVAANTPVQLEAARLSETQATARYRAGLANIAEVAEAQSLLAQAEYQYAVARVAVWRSELARAVAFADVAALAGLASAGSQ